MTPDYAEILRLYRKFRARPDEPLWVTFVMIGQELERMNMVGDKRRSASVDSEALAQSSEPPSQPFFSTQWEREDYERRRRGEPERGPLSKGADFAAWWGRGGLSRS